MNIKTIYCELIYHDIIDAIDKKRKKSTLNRIIREGNKWDKNPRLKQTNYFIKWYRKNQNRFNDYALHDIYKKFFSKHKDNFNIKPFYLTPRTKKKPSPVNHIIMERIKVHTLKQVRRIRNISQLEVSNYLNIDPSVVSKTEKNFKNAQLDTIVKYAQALDATSINIEFQFNGGYEKIVLPLFR